jgi:SAM-dependent methyltransferase
MNSIFKHIKLLVRRLAPARFLAFLRFLPYFAFETLQAKVTTPTGILVPPLWKMFDGPRDKQMFLRNSEEVLRLYKAHGKIQPDSHVLDIGSGLGRKTLSLPEYLSAAGKHVGVDIVRDGVDWCNANISAKHPNFIFLHLNVYNSRYNRHATVKAADYQFPFSENSFDLIVAWSVFTHMYPEDIKNYLRETERMLKPNGRCIFSFYVMTDRAIAAVKGETATERIEHRVGESLFTDNKNVPEDLTAFEESWIRSAYESANLAIDEILYGSWIGDNAPKEFPMTNYQDIVIARRARLSR